MTFGSLLLLVDLRLDSRFARLIPLAASVLVGFLTFRGLLGGGRFFCRLGIVCFNALLCALYMLRFIRLVALLSLMTLLGFPGVGLFSSFRLRLFGLGLLAVFAFLLVVLNFRLPAAGRFLLCFGFL